MTEGNGTADPDALTPVTRKPLEAITHEQRIRLFGAFGFTWHPIPQRTYDPVKHTAAVPGNPEHVEISEIWKRQFLIKVDVPHIGRTCQIHRAIEKQFYGFWTALYDRGLTADVKTFNGAWASRYKRQNGTYDERYEACRKISAQTTLSAQSLSNHCWGTAFDLNADYNRLGEPGAAPGEPGSMHRIIPVAEEFGFFSGSKFHSRPDWMHLECAVVLE